MRFSEYAPVGGLQRCWYCKRSGDGYARYETERKEYRVVIVHVCPNCTGRAERGERGNG